MRAWLEGNEADLAIFLTPGMGRFTRVSRIALGLVSFCRV